MTISSWETEVEEAFFKWVFSSFKSWQETTSGKIRLAFFSSCSDYILSKLGSELWVKDQGPFLKHHILQNSISARNHTERENWSVDTFQARVSHPTGDWVLQKHGNWLCLCQELNRFLFFPRRSVQGCGCWRQGKAVIHSWEQVGCGGPSLQLPSLKVFWASHFLNAKETCWFHSWEFLL